MCQPIRCRVCRKTTWTGCGQHVTAVRLTVPAAQWCDGSHPTSEIEAARQARGGFFSRLFGRSTTAGS
ncbi:hypothetical protein [Microbacterium sp.]|uniref:hypothetical protein n=1 Tax=Microbacterium sp. TaxID=51671 RepID=UPI0037CABC2E